MIHLLPIRPTYGGDGSRVPALAHLAFEALLQNTSDIELYRIVYEAGWDVAMRMYQMVDLPDHQATPASRALLQRVDNIWNQLETDNPTDRRPFGEGATTRSRADRSRKQRYRPIFPGL
jgi:hypothetical protein